MKSMYNGILVINKEKGFTSFDVVAKLRGIFGQKKIGHTGTLDPDATGVLPVCLGNATKACDMLTDSDKIYETVLLLGKETDTQDITGEVLKESPVTVSEEEVLQAINSFWGKSLQIPPMYSALKVNGQKLCDLAREGKIIERKPREITVYEIVIKKVELPRVRIQFSCSKGTYIRTLCHDIGQKLGCGGCMESLVRTKAAGFSIDQALTLPKVQQAKDEGRLGELVMPVDTVFQMYPAMKVSKEAHHMLMNGNSLRGDAFGTARESKVFENYLMPFEEKDVSCDDVKQRSDQYYRMPVRVYDKDGVFAAIYQYHEEKGCFCPVKMFLS